MASQTEQIVQIPIHGVNIEGALELPPQPKGIVLFVHGSGSSRHSPRNNYVAAALRENGIGTLLIDLLTEEEDRDVRARFDISLLFRRLLAITRWVRAEKQTFGLPLGYFGASTGAAAALQAAAEFGKSVGAVVARGGRPDLAGDDALKNVKSPTLLLVGGLDDAVIEINQNAYAKMICPKELTIIAGATHLFEEPGTLEAVAREASTWFGRYLGSSKK